MIAEVGEDEWAGTDIAKPLACLDSRPAYITSKEHSSRWPNEVFKQALSASHDNILPCWQVLPEFLAETKYQNQSDGAHSSF